MKMINEAKSMKTFKYISVLLFLISTGFATAQVTFEAKVSKTTLGVNERLRVDFEMNKDGDNFNPPNFDNFMVVGGPNQAVSHSWVNGKKSFSKTYSFYLAPKGLGTFTIKQATIEIDGEIYKTTPVKVKVTKAVDKPKDGNNADYIASENIHLVAEVSKTDPYLNEGITVEYRLYVSANTGVSNWREIESPKYSDFWSQNIDIKVPKVQNGSYKGEPYRYVVLRKTVLYPQKSGKLEIEPLSLDITIEVPTNRRDIFGSRLMTQVHKTISAGSKTIKVKPLPEEGKPANFTGAVGEFDFAVVTSKTELNASESFRAKLEVKGKGNLKLFEIPKPTFPSSLEVYEPEHDENVRTDEKLGMNGSISDTYTIVPQYKGKYPIPSISFSYFDLKTKSYKEVSSGEILISVIDGPTNNSSSDNAITSVNANKQEVKTSGNHLAFIKTDTSLSPIEGDDFFGSNGFWALLLAPLLAIPLAIVFRRKADERRADVVGNRLRQADKLAKRYLGEAKKSLGNKEAFYIALEKALHNYLKAKLSIETSDMSKEKIQALLQEKGAEEPTVLSFMQILHNCELARYTPITQVEMQQDYQKAAETINLVDKQMR